MYREARDTVTRRVLVLWQKGAAALLQQEGDASSLGSISSLGCGLMWHGLYFFLG